MQFLKEKSMLKGKSFIVTIKGVALYAYLLQKTTSVVFEASYFAWTSYLTILRRTNIFPRFRFVLLLIELLNGLIISLVL